MGENPTPQPPNRLAIVVGNSGYAERAHHDLANAVNDAEGLAQSLRRLKFDVLPGADLSTDGFGRLSRGPTRDAERSAPC